MWRVGDFQRPLTSWEDWLSLAACTATSLPVSSEGEISPKDAAVALCVSDQLDSKDRDEPAGSSREPWLAFWAHPQPTSDNLSLLPRVFPISQVPIPTGSVSSQVSDGKGADKLIPVED